MPSLKRRAANLIEKVSGNLVVPPHELHQVYEQEQLRRFFLHFEVDCVFDVGANAGQYADMLRQKIGFQGPIVSFEPIPELAAELQARATTDPHWHVEVLALDREAGPSSFHVMEGSQFSSLWHPAEDQPDFLRQQNSVARTIEVMRATLTEAVAKWQGRLGFRRGFLKMDTQGNDLAVVEGGRGVLDHFVGLQSELSFRRLYDGGADYAATIAAFRALGFELSAMLPNNAGHFPLLLEMDCIMFRTT
jgi:FkbM family methyltransferase